MNDLRKAAFEFGTRAVIKPGIRVSYVTLESRHIAEQIELDDFFTSPAEHCDAAAPLGGKQEFQ